MQFANHSHGTNNYHPERKHCRFLCVRNEKHSSLHRNWNIYLAIHGISRQIKSSCIRKPHQVKKTVRAIGSLYSIRHSVQTYSHE